MFIYMYIYIVFLLFIYDGKDDEQEEKFYLIIRELINNYIHLFCFILLKDEFSFLFLFIYFNLFTLFMKLLFQFCYL